MYFNPRSPHGERHLLTEYNTVTGLISIHAPRTGSDVRFPSEVSAPGISIHAPRTGSDGFTVDVAGRRYDFNPRSPHGERPFHFLLHDFDKHFNPRSPHGERHAPSPDPNNYKQFQSTLPARGATPCNGVVLRQQIFQSTLPARGATVSASAIMFV